jgi:serine O-acetyltransferase
MSPALRHNDDAPTRFHHIVEGLREGREAWRASHHAHVEYGAFGFPARRPVERAVAMLGGVLFPLRLGAPELNPSNEDAWVEATLENALSLLGSQIRLELGYSHRDAGDARIDPEVERIVHAFGDALPEIRALLDTDVEAAYLGDPAAQSVDEVLLCYPSAIAVIHYRIAHILYKLGAPLVARIITELAHSTTGIDIHPGAQIGRSFFIDHGTGVVIGETATVGAHVKLYQGVTLGAKSFEVDEEGRPVKGVKRHPDIGDHVTIYAHATILGGDTHVGAHSIIGSNVWLLKSIPDDSVAYFKGDNLTIRSRRKKEALVETGGPSHEHDWEI